MLKLKSLLGLIGISLLLIGCADHCISSGDNVEGRVTFSAGQNLVPGADIYIQAASDTGYATVISQRSLSNTQGLVSVPFTYCAPQNTATYFRAFQDTDGNTVYTAGEPAGQHDATNGSNGTPTPVTVQVNAAGGSEIAKDVDFFLDLTTQ